MRGDIICYTARAKRAPRRAKRGGTARKSPTERPLIVDFSDNLSTSPTGLARRHIGGKIDDIASEGGDFRAALHDGLYYQKSAL